MKEEENEPELKPDHEPEPEPEQEHISSEKDKDELNDSSEMLPPLEPNYKTQSQLLEKDIRSFIISLSVGIGIFLLFLGLGIFLTIYKSTMFGKIFLAMSVFALIIVIFNLISVLLFKHKFSTFLKKGQESVTDIEILQQGESYEELLKSTESSMMNLGLYLIMTLILVYAIFGVSCVSFNSQVKSEVNVYANDQAVWRDVYQTFTYSDIILYLTSFMIGLGILSIFTCAYVCYLFYLSFKILGFFHIYQRIVQFISMLFLQLGIAFLYLTIYSNRFKDLSIINPSIPEWIPIALLTSSIIVILVAVSGYVAATTKSIPWLILTCVTTGLFLAMFIVFAFCSVISTHSLEKFSDTQCPAFVDYFNQNYIMSNNNCPKYTSINADLTKLNCPKERIVKAWENNLSLPLRSPTNSPKIEYYGCINISCCYQMYNFVQIFMNYISLFCFCLIAFGLILIGTSFYLTTLLEQNITVGAEEKASQYFVYCFVGIITVFFIVLLSRIKKPEYSPNYSIQFASADSSSAYGVDTMFLPYSVLKDNSTQLKSVYETIRNQIKARTVLIEDSSMCEKEKCNVLQYKVEIKSSTFKMKVDKALAQRHQFEAEVSSDGLSVILKSYSSHLSFIYPDLFIFESSCPLETKMANVKISATGMESYPVPSSFIQTKMKGAPTNISRNRNQEQTPVYYPEINGQVNLTEINMAKVLVGIKYDFFNEEIDFSIIDSSKTQSFQGVVYTSSPDHKLALSSNQLITIQYLNFPSCNKEIIQTTDKGLFSLQNIPVLKNNVINEVKLYFGENELTKTIKTGGPGFEANHLLPTVILLQNSGELVFNDDNHFNLYAFTSYVIDSITLKPIENAMLTFYEGEVYFPNTQSNTTKYDTMNSGKIFSTTATDEKGYLLMKDLLKEVYTVLIQKEFYYKEALVIHPKARIYSIPLTPMVYVKNQYRIVLEWPRGPSDLNLFSYFKVTDAIQCEVFFGNRNCQKTTMNNYNYNNGTHGVQVITIDEVGNYNYGFAVSRYSVRDDPVGRNETKVEGAEKEAPKWEYPQFMRNFSEKEEREADITLSQAKLSIYLADYQMKVYSITLNDKRKIEHKDDELVWWLGFCFNGNSGIKSLTPINTFTQDKPTYQMCEK